MSKFDPLFGNTGASFKHPKLIMAVYWLIFAVLPIGVVIYALVN